MLLYCSFPKPEGYRGGTCNMQYVEVTLKQSQWIVGPELQLAARVEHSCRDVV